MAELTEELPSTNHTTRASAPDAVVQRTRIPKVETDRPDAKEPRTARELDVTQLYLNEIGFSPLLTPEEEVYYAQSITAGRGIGPQTDDREQSASRCEDRAPLHQPRADPPGPH